MEEKDFDCILALIHKIDTLEIQYRHGHYVSLDIIVEEAFLRNPETGLHYIQKNSLQLPCRAKSTWKNNKSSYCFNKSKMLYVYGRCLQVGLIHNAFSGNLNSSTRYQAMLSTKISQVFN